jgi:hypothetical protein
VLNPQVNGVRFDITRTGSPSPRQVASTERRVAHEAAELEHDAEQYPDERGEILLEASMAWRRAATTTAPITFSNRSPKLVERMPPTLGSSSPATPSTKETALQRHPGWTQTRLRYVATVLEERHIRRPPARNDRCWCGSGVQYKECCGRPNL